MMTQAWFALSETIPACGVVRRELLPVNRAWHGAAVPDAVLKQSLFDVNEQNE